MGNTTSASRDIPIIAAPIPQPLQETTNAPSTIASKTQKLVADTLKTGSPSDTIHMTPIHSATLGPAHEASPTPSLPIEEGTPQGVVHTPYHQSGAPTGPFQPQSSELNHTVLRDKRAELLGFSQAPISERERAYSIIDSLHHLVHYFHMFTEPALFQEGAQLVLEYVAQLNQDDALPILGKLTEYLDRIENPDLQKAIIDRLQNPNVQTPSPNTLSAPPPPSPRIPPIAQYQTPQRIELIGELAPSNTTTCPTENIKTISELIPRIRQACYASPSDPIELLLGNEVLDENALLSEYPLTPRTSLTVQFKETAPLSSTSKVAAPLAPLSTKSLVETYLKRPVLPITYQTAERVETAKGVGATPKERHADKARLLQTIEQSNIQFQGYLSEGTAGVIEKATMPTGSKVVVRADLHGDLASLLGELKLLQQQGLLDAQYKTTGNTQLVFLGDYVDRGPNDIELLTLLLQLRMENPTSVHLIRGNHEDLPINNMFNRDADFFQTHATEIQRCYRTLPLAVCMACQEPGVAGSGASQQQFVHFSHGMFSPAVNLSSFLRQERTNLLPVPYYPRFTEEAEGTTLKAKSAFQQLRTMVGPHEGVNFSGGYLWSDIDQTLHLSSKRGGGIYAVPPELMHLYFQAQQTEDISIKALFRGHEHQQAEYTVASAKAPEKQKVIATTLAVGISGGVYSSAFPQEKSQGMLLSVQPRVRDWTKQAITMTRDLAYTLPTLEIQPQSIGMYARSV